MNVGREDRKGLSTGQDQPYKIMTVLMGVIGELGPRLKLILGLYSPLLTPKTYSYPVKFTVKLSFL